MSSGWAAIAIADCRLPIADWNWRGRESFWERLAIAGDSIGNRQWAIDNPQCGCFLCAWRSAELSAAKITSWVRNAWDRLVSGISCPELIALKNASNCV